MPPEVDELLHLFGQRLFKEKYCCSKLVILVKDVGYIISTIIISGQKIGNILYRNKARVSK